MLKAWKILKQMEFGIYSENISLLASHISTRHLFAVAIAALPQICWANNLTDCDFICEI